MEIANAFTRSLDMCVIPFDTGIACDLVTTVSAVATNEPGPDRHAPLFLAAEDTLSKYVFTGICSCGYMSLVESSFAIVAEPNRRAILSLLLSSERSVGEIERELRLPQPSVSKHLR